eukprot:3941355-Rhodomonas_salina.1
MPKHKHPQLNRQSQHWQADNAASLDSESTLARSFHGQARLKQALAHNLKRALLRCGGIMLRAAGIELRRGRVRGRGGRVHLSLPCRS